MVPTPVWEMRTRTHLSLGFCSWCWTAQASGRSPLVARWRWRPFASLHCLCSGGSTSPRHNWTKYTTPNAICKRNVKTTFVHTKEIKLGEFETHPILIYRCCVVLFEFSLLCLVSELLLNKNCRVGSKRLARIHTEVWLPAWLKFARPAVGFSVKSAGNWKTAVNPAQFRTAQPLSNLVGFWIMQVYSHLLSGPSSKHGQQQVFLCCSAWKRVSCDRIGATRQSVLNLPSYVPLGIGSGVTECELPELISLELLLYSFLPPPPGIAKLGRSRIGWRTEKKNHSVTPRPYGIYTNKDIQHSDCPKRA